MTKRSNLVRNVRAAAVTGVRSVALRSASGSGYFWAVAVTVSIDYNSLATELFGTNGTVNYVVIRSFAFTIGINVVLNNSLTFGMINHRDLYISFGVIAPGANLVSIPTYLGTGRSLSYGIGDVVSQRVHSVRFVLELTRARVYRVAILGTGRVEHFSGKDVSVIVSDRCDVIPG